MLVNISCVKVRKSWSLTEYIFQMQLSNLFRGMYTKIKFYQFMGGGGQKNNLKGRGYHGKNKKFYFTFFFKMISQ